MDEKKHRDSKLSCPGDGGRTNRCGFQLNKIFVTQHYNAPRNNKKNNRPNRQRTIKYGLFVRAFCKFMNFINAASRDGRVMDKIFEEEILLLNRLWSFYEGS